MRALLLKILVYYVDVVILLVVSFAGGAVILFYMQGTNILSDPKDREFAEFYLFCIPFIAALIAIPASGARHATQILKNDPNAKCTLISCPK